MKILILLEAAGGGVARHVLDLVRQFTEAEITDGSGKAQPSCRHEVTVVYSPLRAEPAFIEDLYALPVEAIALNMTRAPGPHDLIALWRLYLIVRARGPYDILHAHSSKAGVLLRLLPRRFGARIYTPHGLRIMDPQIGSVIKRFYGAVECVLGRWRSEAVITVASRELTEAQQLGLPVLLLHLVLNGVEANLAVSDIGAGPKRAELGLSSNDLVFGFVGRLAPQKAPDRLIQAFVAVAPQAPQARLVIIGDGPLRAGLEQQVADNGLEAQVLFLGARRARYYLPLFDVFVLSSLYEAMPYVLLEALAAHVPIIAHDVSGTEISIEPDVNGVVVPLELGANGLADAMREALQPTRLAQWRAGARSKMRHHDVRRMAAETEAVYRHVLDYPRQVPVKIPTRA